MSFVFDLKYLSQNSINFNMLGVFWNPQDEQFLKLSLDLHFEQYLKEILRVYTAEGQVGHHCIYVLLCLVRVKLLELVCGEKYKQFQLYSLFSLLVYIYMEQ